MLCEDCKNARKTRPTELMDKGHFGCSILANERISAKTAASGMTAEVVGTGWVDLNCRPKSTTGGGMLLNFQLIVKGVTSCKYYRRTNEP